jgi:hypothetical protein
VDGAVVVHAGATVVTLNATTAALISVQRVATGSPAIEFLPHGFAGVPLFTLALTRPSDFGGPLQVQSSDFRSFVHSPPSHLHSARLDCSHLVLSMYSTLCTRVHARLQNLWGCR